MDSSRNTFSQLIIKHSGIIKSLCAIYYHDFEDRKDTEQDIILQLWKSFESFRGESNVSTWIYRVSLNTILTKTRKESKLPNNESINVYHENSISATSQSDDDLQLLKQIIELLNPLDKAIVILYLEGYKNKETADLLNISPSNISTRLNRIKAQLKSKFKIYNNELR